MSGTPGTLLGESFLLGAQIPLKVANAQGLYCQLHPVRGSQNLQIAFPIMVPPVGPEVKRWAWAK